MTIREIRRQKDITQKQLADAIGVTVGAISKYENGTLVPSLKRLAMIAQVLGVPVESIDDQISEYAGQLLLVNSLQSPPDYFMKSFERMMILETNGKCEFCHNDAPFTTPDNRPYLKLYKFDESNGPIPELNYVALCPNCYERLTVLKNKDDISTLRQIAQKHYYVR